MIFEHFLATILIWLTQVRAVLKHLDAFSNISGCLDQVDAGPYDFEAFGRIFEHFAVQV